MIDTCGDVFYQEYYPKKLIYSLGFIKNLNLPVFLSGGAVRDLIIGNIPNDLDITVSHNALEIAKEYSKIVNGTYVLLDEQEQVARVVWQNKIIDFSSYRENTTNINDDLACRDFTINALALPYDFDKNQFKDLCCLVDPLNGSNDIKNRLIKQTSSKVFVNDPLRLLRAFRFSCSTGWQIENVTFQNIKNNYELIKNVSVERISYELNEIILNKRSASCFKKLKETGLLTELFPEIAKGMGLKQPEIHHLDVIDHNIEALSCLEDVISDPSHYFPGDDKIFSKYLMDSKRILWLKWAAIFHDLGKPNAFEIRNNRRTFYNHDNIGADLATQIAKRFRWSKIEQKKISKFIKHHMWPFHLNNALKKTGIKPKACLKIYKSLGDELPGLFLLAMADSLAASGPEKPKDMESDLVALHNKISTVIRERIEPVCSEPPLLNGYDLIKIFQLSPGKIFKEILEGLQKEQVADPQMDREKAIAWVKNLLKDG